MIKYKIRDLFWDHYLGNRFGNWIIKKLGGFTIIDMNLAIERWTKIAHRYEEEGYQKAKEKYGKL